MKAEPFAAYRFDGRSAAALPVWVRVDDGNLTVETEEGTLLEEQRVDQSIACEPFSNVPRVITLQSGATLEIADNDQRFLQALEQYGVRPSLAVRQRAWWPAALVAVASLVALSAFAYFEWLPAAVRRVAFALPPELEARMGAEVLSMLDGRFFAPSRLDEAQRARLADRFSKAAGAAAPEVGYRLEFRYAGDDVANAMALPGGVIIVLDGLVTLADGEDRVVAVLGHELGHVAHRHSLRQFFQSIGIGAIAGLLWGDFSSMATSVPLVLGLMKYSRDFEREADDFAVAFLRRQNLSARPLYEFFSRVEAHEQGKAHSAMPSFLSSHPPTDERRHRLQGLDADAPEIVPGTNAGAADPIHTD